MPALTEGLGADAPVLAYHFFASHGLGFTVTLIFFGMHLVLLGVLIARADYMPRVIGWLASVAGLAYLGDGFGTILLGSYGAYAEPVTAVVIITAIVGEAALMLWLIVWLVYDTPDVASWGPWNSWGIALFEYLLQVPANRIGHAQLTVSQLKIMQEVITLAVFVPFAVFYMGQEIRMNFVYAGVCLLGAVYFIFRG